MHGQWQRPRCDAPGLATPPILACGGCPRDLPQGYAARFPYSRVRGLFLTHKSENGFLLQKTPALPLSRPKVNRRTDHTKVTKMHAPWNAWTLARGCVRCARVFCSHTTNGVLMRHVLVRGQSIIQSDMWVIHSAQGRRVRLVVVPSGVHTGGRLLPRPRKRTVGPARGDFSRWQLWECISERRVIHVVFDQLLRFG